MRENQLNGGWRGSDFLRRYFVTVDGDQRLSVSVLAHLKTALGCPYPARGIFPLFPTPPIILFFVGVLLIGLPGSAASGTPVVDPGTARLSGYSRVVPLGAAGYSFGTATDGEDVYFSDFSAGTITRVSGGVSTSLKNGLNGIYGLALGGDKMYFAREYDNNFGSAKIFGMTRNGGTWGNPVQVMGGLTRPRQIFVESSGTLLLAVEALSQGQGGAVLRIDPSSGVATPLVTNAICPQAAVSDAAGNLYFNEYGSTTADGTPTITGKLWKLPAGGTNKTMLLEGRRLRGLALVPGSPGQLVQLTESNHGDQGNSSTISILTTTGTLLHTIEGVDYPQFTGVSASGNVVTTCPRDEAILSILPGNNFGTDTAFALRNGVDCFASVHGTAYPTSGDGRYPVTINGMDGGPLTFYVTPDRNKKYAGWLRMTKSQWPNISTNEMVSRPGYYALPQPGIQSTGTLDRLQIFPHRSRNISRWPMTNVGTAQEAPQPGFSEAPDAYLAYIEISQVPPIVSWDGGAGTNSYSWSTAENWSGNALPGSGDDVLIVFGGAYVTNAVGPVGDVVVGNASANGALNVLSGGSLRAASIVIGSSGNSAGGTGYPNYLRTADGGAITTTGDFVVGAKGAKVDGICSQSDITVGGDLKIGSGYPDPGGSSLSFGGASGTIRSGSLTIGGGVKLIMDFIGGNGIRSLATTGEVTLEEGSSIKIVGNTNIIAGSNCRLIDGAAGRLSGDFTHVEFEGFPSTVAPNLVYSLADGDVGLWVGVAGTFASWFGSPPPTDNRILLQYAVGGAAHPSATPEEMVTASDGGNLSVSAIVRVNDPKLRVVGQSSANLDGPWLDLTSYATGVLSPDQSGVAMGCQRRIFFVQQGSESRLFLRLLVTLSQ